ncbi:MAG: S1 RNA-binding domain-containing protein [Clostridia bacterium]|nr:S1 RNA-binding domain-containing protein [Clostridia bacterium]MBQ7289199.1 S1 RNA-binding domain-containing protein [Clostridia bacterium]
MQQLTVGQIVEGKITGITNFGVFVDLGEGKSGMVHISEVALTYVSNIRDHVKEGDTVQVKILNIGEDGKIALSIKKALEQNNRAKAAPKKPKPRFNDSFSSFGTPKSEPESFEEMMNRFKQNSEEKFSDLKRKNADMRRSKRGAMSR